MATFTVSRKTWYRGQGGERSRLLCSDGRRCCIGFVGQQCGVPDMAMLGVWGVRAVDAQRSLFPAWLHNDSASGPAYVVNDDPTLDDDAREVRLKKIFAAHGDEIVFVE